MVKKSKYGFATALKKFGSIGIFKRTDGRVKVGQIKDGQILNRYGKTQINIRKK